jgi:hypothetical protein
MKIVSRRGRRLLYPPYVQRYLDRLTAADQLAGSNLGLELVVTDGINIFLESMVNAGFLGTSNGVLAGASSIIKTGGLLVGARTRTATLTTYAEDMPLPQQFNFSESSYNRRTGWRANGINQYINLNFNNNTVGQNSHQTVYVTTPGTRSGFQPYIAGGATATGTSLIMQNSTTSLFFRNRNATGLSVGGAAVTATGYIGHSRSSSSQISTRWGGTTFLVAQNAETPASAPTLLFARNNTSTTPANYSAGGIAAYSAGETLADHSAYESYLITLMSALQGIQ